MKFIKLESRGGNYLVVAENVAWLRTAENGQTSVGIIGGQPLLVVGSIEEVADKILSATAEAEAAAPVPAPAPVVAPAPVAAAPAPQPTAPPAPEPVPEPVAAAPAPEPEPAPETEEAAEAAPAPAPAVAKIPTPARPRTTSARSAAQWERPSSAAAAGMKLKGGSQRMMGRFE